MPDGNSTPIGPIGASTPTGGVTLEQLYAVIGSKEVLICQQNAIIQQFQHQLQQVQQQLDAVKRECAALRFGPGDAAQHG